MRSEVGADAFPASMGGSIANYQRGVSSGWAWTLAALEIPYELVPPTSWQRAMHAGTAGGSIKQRSVLAAQSRTTAWPRRS